MTRPPLARLLSPRSIAVVGGREAAEVIRQCERIGFRGPIWPVNPRRAEVAGRPAFASIDALPEAPDAAFVAVPREATVDAVAALAAKGAGGAVCYASGFAEVGEDGAELQRRLVEASGAMALLGPNCYGLINYLDGAALWPDQHGGVARERGVAILTQSGNIGLNLTMQARSLPIAYLATVGNKAKGDLHEIVEAFLDDPRVTAIGLHVEGIADVAAFAAAAQRALAQGVPVVAVKTGRSEAGAALTMSHTSSLAGSDVLADALFERCGVARAPDLSVLLETLKLLHVHGPLPGRTLSSMSCSGGEASLVADLAEAAGLATPPLPATAEAALAAALGSKVPLANPLDYHTYIWGDLAATTATFTAMLSARGEAAPPLSSPAARAAGREGDPGAEHAPPGRTGPGSPSRAASPRAGDEKDGTSPRAPADEGRAYTVNLLVLDLPRADRCDASSWDVTLEAFKTAVRETGARGIVVSSLPETLPEAVGERLVAAGIAPMQDLGTCMQAIALAAGIGEAKARPATPPLARPVPLREGASRLLDEAASKALLAGFGLSIPAGEVVAPGEAAAAAERIGYPVVVKAVSDAIAHKTEAGAVRLNLRTPQEVEAAAAHMATLSDRVLVERMQHGAVAELIVGVTRDPQFGPTLTFGAGGILVELLSDAATVLLPTTAEDVTRKLEGLRSAILLRGFRGRPPGDIPAAVEAILAVARFAQAHADRLLELDVNPLIVLPQGCGAVAADALVRLAGDA